MQKVVDCRGNKVNSNFVLSVLSFTNMFLKGVKSTEHTLPSLITLQRFYLENMYRKVLDSFNFDLPFYFAFFLPQNDNLFMG